MKMIKFMMLNNVAIAVNPDLVTMLINEDGKHTRIVFSIDHQHTVNGTIDEVAAKLCGAYMAK